MDNNKKNSLVLKKQMISVLKSNCISGKNLELLRGMNIARPVFVKEIIVYKSQPDDFMKGEYPDLIILNKLNVLTNTNRTIAKYTSADQSIIECTSDYITKIIGQKNYDTVFNILNSVVSQKHRVQGILALLTGKNGIKEVYCQTDLAFDTEVANSSFSNRLNPSKKNFNDVSSQTFETSSDILQRYKVKKRLRWAPRGPYVLSNDSNTENCVKKIIIQPQNFDTARKLPFRYQKSSYEDAGSATISSTKKKVQKIRDDSVTNITTCVSKSFPDLKSILDEDSNISNFSVSNISLKSCDIPNLLHNPNIVLDHIDKHIKTPEVIESTIIRMLDGSEVKLCSKPIDDFHIATPEILKPLNKEERVKVMWLQAYIDWKLCLTRDEDFNLPIHLAVLNNDVDLLKRQCIVLKKRGKSVDVFTQDVYTPLMISLMLDTTECTEILLKQGANPLLTDEDQRTIFHLAAEKTSGHLKTIFDHCERNARDFLQANHLWTTELDSLADEEIIRYMYMKVCRMYDDQGHTPLMLASKMGNYVNVQMLVDADPGSVNMTTSHSRNNALYLAVDACVAYKSNDEKPEILEPHMETIKILLKHGARPDIENYSGNNVNFLCDMLNIPDLTYLISKSHLDKYFDFDAEEDVKKYFSYVLVKDDVGNLNFEEIYRKHRSINEKKISSRNTENAETVCESEVTTTSNTLDSMNAIERQNSKAIAPLTCGSRLKKLVFVNAGSKTITQSNPTTTTTPKIITLNGLVFKEYINKEKTESDSSVLNKPSDEQKEGNKQFVSIETSAEVPAKKLKK